MKTLQGPAKKGAPVTRHPSWLLLAAWLALSLALPLPGASASSRAVAAGSGAAATAPTAIPGPKGAQRAPAGSTASSSAPGTPAPPAAAGPTVTVSTTTPVGAIDPVAPTDAVGLMERLTPEQKIGQLFLTTFGDRRHGPNSDIARLVREQHIGGVILSSTNHNFINNADTPRRSPP